MKSKLLICCSRLQSEWWTWWLRYFNVANGAVMSFVRSRSVHVNSLWRRAPVSGTTHPRCWCIWSTFSPLLWHQPSRTTLQTFYGRQSRFPGCRRQDLERTAGRPRLNVITVFPAYDVAPFEDIFLPAIVLLARDVSSTVASSSSSLRVRVQYPHITA